MPEFQIELIFLNVEHFDIITNKPEIHLKIIICLTKVKLNT